MQNLLSKEEIFELYGKCLKGDRAAQNKLVACHKVLYPFHNEHKIDIKELRKTTNFKQTLKMMYLHLYR